MNTIPDLEYTPPALTSEILETILDRLYQIVPVAKGATNPSISEELREECLDCIYNETIKLGRSLILIKESIDGMDSQIKSLIEYAKQRTTPGLN